MLPDIRDRTILELFYSSGIRRSELTRLEITDLNQDRQTLQVQKGKGNKDRVAPVGSRALHWLQKYLEESRPKLALSQDEKPSSSPATAKDFNPDVLSQKVSPFIKQADLGHEKLETTSIYTQVSIEQLKAVHAKTHPAEAKETDRKSDSKNDDNQLP